MKRTPSNRSAGFIRGVLFFMAFFVFISEGVAQHNHEHLAGRFSASAADSASAAFLVQAREASRQFQDLDEAIGAGYRLLGPDFPGMGEHWVDIRQVVQPGLDPARPPILSYVRIQGHPVLTGVAYAFPLRPGESPPEVPSPDAWHFHDGTVDEETLLLNPPAMHHDEEAADDVRLAMLHAWVWVDNPAGVFEQDNWALPFLRLGLPVPKEVPPQAGKALFLLTGGIDYYSQLVRLAGGLDTAEQEAVLGVLQAHHQRVSLIVGGGDIDEATVEALVEVWMSLWAQVERAVSASLWDRIKMLAG